MRWRTYQSLAEPPDGLTWDDLDRAAYLHAEDGRLFEGYYAFRALTVRMPLLMPLAPLAWLPGMGALGSRAYRWVADEPAPHRVRVPGWSATALIGVSRLPPRNT